MTADVRKVFGRTAIVSVILALWIPILWASYGMYMSIRYGDHHICIEDAKTATFDGSPEPLREGGCFAATVPFGIYRLAYRTRHGKTWAVDLKLDEASSNASTINIDENRISGISK